MCVALNAESNVCALKHRGRKRERERELSVCVRVQWRDESKLLSADIIISSVIGLGGASVYLLLGCTTHSLLI